MPTNSEILTDHHLAQMGLNPSPEARAFIVHALDKAMRVDVNGEKATVTLHHPHGGKMISVDRQGNVIDMGLEEFMRDIVTSNRHLFPSAAPASITQNPFKAESWNATRQMELWRDNAELAERLEIEALTGAPAPASKSQTSTRPTMNPWRKETWNVTQQYTIENTNPSEAERLQREAGAL